jgi:hypothetical protein
VHCYVEGHIFRGPDIVALPRKGQKKKGTPFYWFIDAGKYHICQPNNKTPRKQIERNFLANHCLNDSNCSLELNHAAMGSVLRLQ